MGKTIHLAHLSGHHPPLPLPPTQQKKLFFKQKNKNTSASKNQFPRKEKFFYNNRKLKFSKQKLFL